MFRQCVVDIGIRRRGLLASSAEADMICPDWQ